MSTTKAEITEVVQDVEVFIRNAQALIRSFMPVGLGVEFSDAEKECLSELAQCRDRFRRMVKKAQRDHGWAID